METIGSSNDLRPQAPPPKQIHEIPVSPGVSFDLGFSGLLVAELIRTGEFRV